MSDLFGAQSLGRMRQLRRSGFSMLRCVSWYGHAFSEIVAGAILCPHCGTSHKLRSKNATQINCTAWNGHRFKLSHDKTVAFCKNCGMITDVTN